MAEPQTTAIPTPRLSDRDRIDVLLDHQQHLTDDLGTVIDLLWAFVQADGPDETDLARRRARAFLLLTP